MQKSIEPVAYSGQKMSPFHDAECNTFTDSSDNDKSAGAHVMSVIVTESTFRSMFSLYGLQNGCDSKICGINRRIDTV